MSATNGTTSIARIEANRANARRSTGPRTEAGKQASRGNALKHGMTAKVVAAAGEDQALLQAESQAWVEELSRESLVAAQFAEEAFQALVKLRRCRRAEDARLRIRVANAGRLLEVNRARQVQRALDLLPKAPAVAVARLKSSLLGCRRLIENWQYLAARCNVHEWSNEDLERASRLQGRDGISGYELARKTEAILDFRKLEQALRAQGKCSLFWSEEEIIEASAPDDEIGGMLAMKQAGNQAAAWIRAICLRQIEDLEQLIPELEEVAEIEEEEAVNLAFHDDGRAAQLRERYASAAERQLHRSHKAALVSEMNRRAELRFEKPETPAEAPAEPEPEPVVELRNEPNDATQPQKEKTVAFAPTSPPEPSGNENERPESPSRREPEEEETLGSVFDHDCDSGGGSS